MNPFTFHGPAFLLFYLVLIAVAGAVVLQLRRRLGPDGLPAKRLTDPYTIALLRGGSDEATRLIALSLVRRELLTCAGRNLQAAAGAIEQAKDSAEQALLLRCATPQEGYVLLASRTVARQLEPRRQELLALAAIPDDGLELRHRLIALAALVVVAGIGLTKLVIALDNGHSNVLFLILLGLGATIWMLWFVAKPPTITPRGHALLDELRALFTTLRGHAVARRLDEELFLAAVFGATALGVTDQLVMQQAFVTPPQSNSPGCGSSSNSGCSSSGGSSCSSSCGGGGCGGCGGGS